jgi:hypothetical protein
MRGEYGPAMEITMACSSMYMGFDYS